MDKTAGFVARNGPEFEARIQSNEQNNPKFNFLKQGDPYNAYYRNKVKEIRESKASGAPTVPTAPGQTTLASVSQKTSQQLQSLAEPPVIVRDPPPEFEFSVEPPTLSAQDLDIVKLTAQFVAIHGRSFLTNLMAREQRNYQFDFLRPQHGLFSYFTQLIEQFTKILMPPKSIVSDLRESIQSDKALMEKIRYRVEWTKIREAERRREEEEAERERVQYAQIDWHDFVLVESVDYQPGESGLFPPPTTPEQVGSRILLQQRIEEHGQGMDEMEVESDDENPEDGNPEDGNPGAKSTEGESETAPKSMPPPLPPSLDSVVIRKDYDPKAKTGSGVVSVQKDAWVISPITGERIPAEKLEDHMRYGLLDPRWIEERERSVSEKKNQEEVYAPGTDIGSSLSRLAERRTDIFGSGLEETAIGKKMGEEEDPARKEPVKPQWDGFKSSVEAVKAAGRANVSIEEQIQQIHKVKGLLPDPDKDKIGPTPTSAQTVNPPSAQTLNPASAQTVNLPPLNQALRPIPVSMVTTQVPTPAPQMLITSTQGSFMVPAPLMPPMLGMYGLMPAPMVDPNLAFGTPSSGVPSEEPVSKKQKTEETLIPEADFLKANPSEVAFTVAVPQVDKSDWQLNGQNLHVTLALTDTISEVKKMIHQSIGMPPGKQKLQLEGIFVKDANSLAFYNVTPSSVFQLQLKERGGRKK